MTDNGLLRWEVWALAQKQHSHHGMSCTWEVARDVESTSRLGLLALSW